MKDFDFSYPELFVGFHSGWSKDDEPTKGLHLTFRDKVRLSEISSEILEELDEDVHNIPALIKNKSGSLAGLTCGVGGALVKFSGKTYKFKRCGVKYNGFVENYLKDRQLKFLDKEILESSTFEHGGALDYIDAKREVKNILRLKKEGFIVPYTPVGIRSITLGFEGDDQYSSLIFEIESDLRADEFCMAVITNICSRCKKYVKYDNKQDYIFVDRLELSNLLSKNSDRFDILRRLGISIGNLYRKLHKKGFVRGLGNSWYGNEVLMPDGNIGLCDLDATYNVKDFPKLKDILNEFQNNDINLFITGTYSSLSYFENSIFDFSAEFFLRGFREGYYLGKKSKLTPKEISEEINTFLRLRKKGFLYGKR